jgi:outer membrane protein TolC
MRYKYKKNFLILGLSFVMQISAQENKVLTVSIQDLFVLADQQNRDLKILDNNQKIAELKIKEEKQKLLPSVEASLAFSYNGDGWIMDRNFSNGFKAAIPDFGNNFVLEAKQIIYAGKAINTSVEIAKMGHQIAQLEKEKSKQSIRFLIAGYYLEMLKLQNQKVVMEKNILQTKKMIEQIAAKNNQGVALKNNITRYELQLQTLNLSLLQLNNSSTILNNELIQLLQLPLETKFEPKIDEIKNALNNIGNETQQWQTIADENAPVLKQSLLDIEVAKKKEKIVKSDKLPQVFAFAGDYLNGPIMIEIPSINKNFNYWYAGVGIKYNLASLYKNEIKIQQAQMVTTNALEINNQLKEQLAKEITAAKIKYTETIDVYNTRLKNVELATQNYNVIKSRYLNDLALITEMLDAENIKIDAELQAINAQVNIVFQNYQLKKLAGLL